jgi:hypothetical protein
LQTKYPSIKLFRAGLPHSYAFEYQQPMIGQRPQSGRCAKRRSIAASRAMDVSEMDSMYDGGTRFNLNGLNGLSRFTHRAEPAIGFEYKF